tara:strand:+ start:96 stop:431 length:336 start_codon:yes stop_codon:yes gene_type:complete
MTTITLRDSRADGTTSAEKWMALGYLQPQHFTNPGADSWGDEGCCVGDAVLKAFSDSRHAQEIQGHQEAWEARGYWGSCPDWDDDHLDAYLDGFETEAKRIAFERGWEVNA